MILILPQILRLTRVLILAKLPLHFLKEKQILPLNLSLVQPTWKKKEKAMSLPLLELTAVMYLTLLIAPKKAI